MSYMYLYGSNIAHIMYMRPACIVSHRLAKIIQIVGFKCKCKCCLLFSTSFNHMKYVTNNQKLAGLLKQIKNVETNSRRKYDTWTRAWHQYLFAVWFIDQSNLSRETVIGYFVFCFFFFIILLFCYLYLCN